MALSPICVFVYNRLEETKKTIENLKSNREASNSELFIFSDAAKNIESEKSVESVREYLKSIDGFKSIVIIERKYNFGLAMSIISGVSQIIDEYGKVIVLEDDLITSSNFLAYMNQALSFYEFSEKIWSISGFSFPIKFPDGYEFDNTFGVRASSWGWATWKDRWDSVDWDVSDYSQFLKDKGAQREFNKGGSDLCKMLNDQMTGAINSWAIRFCYSQFRQQRFDVYPCVSKIENVGFSSNASHTRGMGNRFSTTIDQSEKSNFNLSENISVAPYIQSQFCKPFSITTRIKYKLLSRFS